MKYLCLKVSSRGILLMRLLNTEKVLGECKSQPWLRSVMGTAMAPNRVAPVGGNDSKYKAHWN